ncbi:uncharacterized protein LOC106460300 isoform X2 [Limulus polyphemus]|uniref:Uncharacterized protein LOC106460300 isoform X2 n=1 Tax=Limulus polyphemus TaxID=6850 RepID=A0ABM1SGE8_LIMPO|nr:uncharacterized protein LOC106460300 isoform X2 [Limulus polyphemus]
MSLEGNPVLVKKKLFVSDCDDVEWRYKKINNFKYWLLYISVWSLLIFVVYCRITTQPEKQDSAFYGMCSVASSFQNFKLTLQNFVVTNIKQAYHFDTLLALGTGITVSLFTWMIIYLDSCQPGIQPPSPLSPRKIRASSGHTFHTGYILALVNGVLFSALALIW